MNGRLVFAVGGEGGGGDAFGVLGDEFDGGDDVDEGFLVTRHRLPRR